MKTEEILPRANDRRSFLKGVGLTGVGLASAATMFKGFTSPVKNVLAAGITDVDILNFALNLEYLEAEYYTVAVSGKTLEQVGVLTSADQSGATTGGQQIPGLASSMSAFYLANALQTNEKDHVILLREALGAAGVLKPTINLAALGYGFGSINEFYEIGRQLEEVGTSAYLGAAPLLTSKAYLAVAGSILTVEAKHTGALRLACIQNGVTSGAVDSMDIPPTSSQPFGLQRYGLQLARTTTQVLDIVYGGSSSTPGGFFPDGLNGTIK